MPHAAKTPWAVRRLGPGDDEQLLAGIALDPSTRATSGAEHRSRVLADPANAHWVAFAQDTVIGYAWGYHLLRADRGTGMLLLYSLDVAPAFRRRGVGTALVKACLDHAQRLDASVWLASNRSNAPAMRLYEGLGARASAEDDVILCFDPAPRA